MNDKDVLEQIGASRRLRQYAPGRTAKSGPERWEQRF